MATVDEDLSQLEKDIRTLKIEFEQFFGGGRSRPPTDTQWRVDTMVRRYNDRVAQLNSGQRFRFNNLAQTYAKYQDMWRKKLMQKEGAVTQHHFGSAAKAIEADRASKAAKVARPAAAAKGASAARAAFSLSFSDPAHEQEKVQELYRNVIEARAESGEKSGAPSLKDFERFVRKKTKELQNKGGRRVEYTVSIEGGRFKLKARISD